MEVRRRKAREWTLFRQVAGNVLPFAHWLPTFILAWLMIALTGGSAPFTLLVLAGVFASLTVGTWAMFDRFGMFQNAEMRRSLRARLSALPEPPPRGRTWFVGMATQAHFGWLDTDEDVGYLSLYPDRLVYVGDRYHLAVPREQVLSVERRPVPFYSLIGYYWTVVRFQDAERGEPNSVRLLSREVDRVLTQQRDANRDLWDGVQIWYQDTANALVLPGGHEALAAARAQAEEEVDAWFASAPTLEVSSPDLTSALEELRGSVPPPPAADLARGERAPQLLTQSVRDLVDAGAPWEETQRALAPLARCFAEAAVFRSNHELLLGVYLALRSRPGATPIEIAPLPPDHALLQDVGLLEEYALVFGEPAAGLEVSAAAPAWQGLRQGRRLQALFARRALGELLEPGGE